ncbi:MFS transporter [Streptomyces griseoviridis]|uniref:Quinol monooxygenase YgiN n=2 Tax=Streptomyces griseoviridis TaxID=45398 RepID=A0ABT9L8J0_STRGD|nr:MFS transporter [Streptomyces griseoviridis]MDP9680026.1 quinol monooxygenase YgiN [Streptomyces griseoviridis]GGT05014.1 hypothetical protein GCM10010240_43000 [Streptomyces griseoviridis]
MFEPGPADGPVLVSVTYRVAPAQRTAFTEAMRHVTRSRRRTGALTRVLHQDVGAPDRFVENCLIASRSEHLAQHHARLTATDRRFEETARRLLAPGTAPEVTHAFCAATGPVVTAGPPDEEPAGVPPAARSAPEAVRTGRTTPDDATGTGPRP